MINKIGILVFALFWLTGCATQPVPMSSRVQANLQSVDSILLIPQDRLEVTVNPTYIGGGLLDQLLASFIDSKRKESATLAAAPITDSIKDFDFRTAIHDAWVTEFSKVESVKFNLPPAVKTYGQKSSDATQQKVTDFHRSAAAAVLFANIEYSLQSGTLIIDAKTEIYPKTLSLRAFAQSPKEGDPLAEGNVIYRKDFSYRKEFITQKNVQRAFHEGIADLTRRVAADISQTQPNRGD